MFHLHRRIGSSYLSAYEDGTECSIMSAFKFRHRGITQKKAYNIVNELHGAEPFLRN